LKTLERAEGLAQIRNVLAGLDEIDSSTDPYAIIVREVRELEILLEAARMLHRDLRDNQLAAVKSGPARPRY
jgi:hypothetical protein